MKLTTIEQRRIKQITAYIKRAKFQRKHQFYPKSSSKKGVNMKCIFCNKETCGSVNVDGKSIGICLKCNRDNTLVTLRAKIKADKEYDQFYDEVIEGKQRKV